MGPVRPTIDPFEKFSAALTMDPRSPWLLMMLQQQGDVPPPGAEGPPPFVPIPIPIPPGVPPGAASSTSVPPRGKPIKGEEEMLDFLMKQDRKNRKGWREDLKQYDED